MSSTTVETLSLRIKPGKDLLEQPRSRRTSEVAFQEPGIDFFRQQRINTQSVANGIATHQKVEDDTVQRVPRPQQEALLLHGPGQRYRLERSQDIPALKSDQEILIKVCTGNVKTEIFSRHRLTYPGVCDRTKSCRLEGAVSGPVEFLFYGFLTRHVGIIISASLRFPGSMAETSQGRW